MDGDTLDDSLRTLYSVNPDEFIAKRKQLVAALNADGRPEDAARVKQAHKPTVAAWVVNSLVHDDPTIVTTLADLGRRLRAAQDGLDADAMRGLSRERQGVVSQLTRRALQVAKRRNPPSTLVDDVRGTFDAAVADSDVAHRLGRIERAEHYSGFGFGFGGDGTPQLTLVRGGQGEPAESAQPEPKKETAVERRRRQRLVAAKQDEFDQADAEAASLEQSIVDAEQDVKRRAKEIDELRAMLDLARNNLEQNRLDLDKWKKRRRQARRELDRMERGLS